MLRMYRQASLASTLHIHIQFQITRRAEVRLELTESLSQAYMFITYIAKGNRHDIIHLRPGTQEG
jgi:hypothetical protein